MAGDRAATAGVRVRRAEVGDADAIAVVHVNAWRETYAGLMPARYLDSLSVAARTEAWRAGLGQRGRVHPVFVGLDAAGNLLGFGLYGPPRATPPAYASEFYAVNVLRRGQGLGLGRALMAAMAGAMLDSGSRSAALWVVRDNLRARQFYERLGGRWVGAAVDEIGGAKLTEMAYGWEDIGPIAGRDGRLRPR